jgi:hypothetical protein
MAPPRRVNVGAFEQFIDSLTDEELRKQREQDSLRAEQQHADFVQAYERNECYLCQKPFRTMSKGEPCLHWLLRQCKFKKKDLPLIYQRFGYTQIAAFTRWAANQERFHGNINDLVEEKSERNIIEFTVKWKNIEWTFHCAKSDYDGHTGIHSNFPHYHFQMRIDGRPFIDFGDFHIPFSEEDLFHIDLTMAIPDKVRHSFGPGGDGMQAAAEVDPYLLIHNSVVSTAENEASYRMQTIMSANPGETIDGNLLVSMIEESRKTGKPLASLVNKYCPPTVSVLSIVSPADTVPAIAHRTERKGR